MYSRTVHIGVCEGAREEGDDLLGGIFLDSLKALAALHNMAQKVKWQCGCCDDEALCVQMDTKVACTHSLSLLLSLRPA